MHNLDEHIIGACQTSRAQGGWEKIRVQG